MCGFKTNNKQVTSAGSWTSRSGTKRRVSGGSLGASEATRPPPPASRGRQPDQTQAEGDSRRRLDNGGQMEEGEDARGSYSLPVKGLTRRNTSITRALGSPSGAPECSVRSLVKEQRSPRRLKVSSARPKFVKNVLLTLVRRLCC